MAKNLHGRLLPSSNRWQRTTAPARQIDDASTAQRRRRCASGQPRRQRSPMAARGATPAVRAGAAHSVRRWQPPCVPRTQLDPCCPAPRRRVRQLSRARQRSHTAQSSRAAPLQREAQAGRRRPLRQRQAADHPALLTGVAAHPQHAQTNAGGCRRAKAAQRQVEPTLKRRHAGRRFAVCRGPQRCAQRVVALVVVRRHKRQRAHLLHVQRTACAGKSKANRKREHSVAPLAHDNSAATAPSVVCSAVHSGTNAFCTNASCVAKGK